MTTVGEWLAERDPEPPAVLRERLSNALAGSLALDATQASDVCLLAGERLLSAVLRRHSSDRDCALDLLTADALVTYAFEAAAGAPADLGQRASAAIARMAALGSTHSVRAPT